MKNLTRDDWLSAKATAYLFTIFMDDFDGQEKLWNEAAHDEGLASVFDSVHDQVIALIAEHAKGGQQ